MQALKESSCKEHERNATNCLQGNADLAVSLVGHFFATKKGLKPYNRKITATKDMPAPNRPWYCQ